MYATNGPFRMPLTSDLLTVCSRKTCPSENMHRMLHYLWRDSCSLTSVSCTLGMRGAIKKHSCLLQPHPGSLLRLQNLLWSRGLHRASILKLERKRRQHSLANPLHFFYNFGRQPSCYSAHGFLHDPDDLDQV